MPEIDAESGFCQAPCDRVSSNLNAWQFVGTGRGGYQVVEKLVWVGEGKGDFHADANSWETRKQRLKFHLCMAFYKGTLAMVLLCLLSGFAMMIPPVASVVNESLPLSTVLGLGRGSDAASLRSSALQSAEATSTPPLTTPARAHMEASSSAQSVRASEDTTTPDADTSGPVQIPTKACEIIGAFDGLKEPCGYRIKLVAAHTFAGRQDGCEQATLLVQWEDSACAQCTQAASGCVNVEFKSDSRPAPIAASEVTRDAPNQERSQSLPTVQSSMSGFPARDLY